MIQLHLNWSMKLNNYIGDPVGGIMALIQGMTWGIFFTYVGYCLLVFTVMICYKELRRAIAGVFYLVPRGMSNTFGFEFEPIRMSYYQPKVRIVYFYIVDNKGHVSCNKLPDHIWVHASAITVVHLTMFHRKAEVYQGKLKGNLDMTFGKRSKADQWSKENRL